jgi:hypothetical protein
MRAGTTHTLGESDMLGVIQKDPKSGWISWGAIQS